MAWLGLEVDDVELASLLEADEYSFLGSWDADALWVSGSIAYGLDTEASDVDVRGFKVRSREEILTGRDFGTRANGGTDTSMHSFDKFLSLLAKANPEALNVLGLPGECVLLRGHALDVILQNADAFVTRRCADTFGGYARAQEKRMRAAADSGGVLVTGNGQKQGRALAKHMCHVLRLYRMGAEILGGRGVIVDRRAAGDADELRAIKLGSMVTPSGSIDERFFELLADGERRFDEAKLKTRLPDDVPDGLVDSILMEVNGSRFAT